jgi:hypothetical protein
MKFYDKLKEINNKSPKPMKKKDWIIFIGFVIGSIAAIIYAQYIVEETKQYHPIPLTNDEIKKIGNTDLRTVVIYPIFTQNAYKPGGFYDYYNGSCITCTIVSLKPLGIDATYNTGKTGFEILQKLNYPFITDMTVDKHPEILNDYDVVILLHNEYMTKTEFNAILNHKNVFYLYPNAMYAEIIVDYKNWTETLVKGHGYDISQNPPYATKKGSGAGNGFGFVTTSQWEYDTKCDNYGWKERPNGIQLSCFPEILLTYDRSPLKVLHDYPHVIPSLIPMVSDHYNLTDMRYCTLDGNCNTKIDDKSNKQN